MDYSHSERNLNRVSADLLIYLMNTESLVNIMLAINLVLDRVRIIKVSTYQRVSIVLFRVLLMELLKKLLIVIFFINKLFISLLFYFFFFLIFFLLFVNNLR